MTEPAPPAAAAVLHLVGPGCRPGDVDTLAALLAGLDVPQRVLALGSGPHADALARAGIEFNLAGLHGPTLEQAGAPGLLHLHGASATDLLSSPRLRRLGAHAALLLTGSPPEADSLARVCRQVRAFVAAPSGPTRDALVQAGLETHKVVLAPPAIRPDRLRSVDRRQARYRLGLAEADGPVLLTAGWCDRRDNVKLPLWATAILSLLYPNLRMIVPGDGPRRLPLEEWIGLAGFAAQCLFCDSRFDWPELVSAADVMVHAAEGPAGLAPLAWAAHARLPIVTVESPEVAWLVEARAALACPPKPRQLAMAIQRILAEPECRDALTANAASAVAGRFTPADAVSRFRDIYLRCAAPVLPVRA